MEREGGAKGVKGTALVGRGKGGKRMCANVCTRVCVCEREWDRSDTSASGRDRARWRNTFRFRCRWRRRLPRTISAAVRQSGGFTG